MVTKWMGDHYVLGFVPALRVLSYSVQTLLLVYNPPCVCRYTHAKRSNVYIYYRSCRTCDCDSSLDNGNIKITQNELKVLTVFIIMIMLKLDTIHYVRKKFLFRLFQITFFFFH